jgi:hypothetical protein
MNSRICVLVSLLGETISPLLWEINSGAVLDWSKQTQLSLMEKKKKTLNHLTHQKINESL